MSKDGIVRSRELLDRQSSRLLVIDLQEKLVPAMHESERLLASVGLLVEAAGRLGVPASASEQYPQGLGCTVSPVCERLSPRPAKLEFSALACLDWPLAGTAATGRDQIVIAGIEAHVCVLQTAFDLMANGYRVVIAADAVSSRSPRDIELALRRLDGAGATITSVESIIFEWLRTAEHPEFKTISALLKGRITPGV